MSAVDLKDKNGYTINVEFGGGKDGVDGVDGKDGKDAIAPTIGKVEAVEGTPCNAEVTLNDDNELEFKFTLEKGAQGNPGINGATGPAGTMTIGTVSTVAPGHSATIVNVGTPSAAVLNFEIPAGARGATGEPFAIYKTYNSIADMQADANNVPEGKLVVIASVSETDPDDGKLFVKNGQGFTFLVNLSGMTGIKGDPGRDGYDGADGTDGVGIQEIVATPVLGGNATNVIIRLTNGTETSFMIPGGEDGNGIDRIVKTGSSGNVDTYTITFTDGTASSMLITNGTNGIDGVSPTVAVGSTISGAPGTQPSVTNSGDSTNVVLDFVIPQGVAGNTPNISALASIDSTSGNPAVSVTRTGTNENPVLNFAFTGLVGPEGPAGPSGTLNTDNSSSLNVNNNEPLSSTILLHKVSKTGSYVDLNNKPNIYGTEFITAETSIFDGSSSSEYVFGVQPTQRLFSLDIIGDYSYADHFSSTDTDVSNFYAVGTIGQTVIDVVEPLDQDGNPTESPRGIVYKKISTLELKKDTLYKLNVTQVLIAAGASGSVTPDTDGYRPETTYSNVSIVSKSPKMSFYIYGSDSVVLNFENEDTSDSNIRNSNIECGVETRASINGTNYVIKTPMTTVITDGSYADGYNTYGVSMYSNVSVGSDLNGGLDGVMNFSLDASNTEFTTKAAFNSLMAGIDADPTAASQIGTRKMYVIDNGDTYLLLFMMPTLYDIGYVDNDEFSDLGSNVKRVVLNIEGEEVVSSNYLSFIP